MFGIPKQSWLLLLVAGAALADDDCRELSLVLYDTYGDGWDAEYALSREDGEVIGTGTLPLGFVQTDTYCVEDTACYVMSVPDSQYPSEMGYEVRDGLGTTIDVFPALGTRFFWMGPDGTVAQVDETCVPAPTPAPTTIDDFFAAFDDFKDRVETDDDDVVVALQEDVYFRFCDLRTLEMINCVVVERPRTTIDGRGFALDGRGASPLLTVSAGASLELRDIDLRNGYAETYSAEGIVGIGGAVYLGAFANLTLVDANLTGNVAEFEGAAIYANQGSRVDIVGGFFRGNEAPNEAGGVIAGVQDAVFVSDGATFESNVAWLQGGVLDAVNMKEIRIRGGSFRHNVAGTGSCVSSIGTTGVFLVEDVVFANNYLSDNARGAGAVLRIDYQWNLAIDVVRRSTFRENDPGFFGVGAAIGVQDSAGQRLEDLVLENNYAGGNDIGGGAIDLAGADDVTITNLYAASNVCGPGKCSGVVIGARSTSNLKIRGSTFVSNNHTAGSGGAVAVWDSAPGSTTTIEGCVFRNNSCTEDGGGLSYAASNDDLLAVRNCTFLSNVDGRQGSAIYVSGEAASVSVEGTLVRDHRRGVGSPLYLEDPGEDVTFANLRCDANVASASGGCLRLTGDFAATVSSSSFADNSAAAGSGGAVAAFRGTLRLVDVDFRRNVAADLGGAVYGVGSDLSFVNATLADNGARSGGAVACEDLSTCAFSGRSDLRSNVAVDGGAIYASESSVDCAADEGVIRRNSATESGGAFYVVDGSLVVHHAASVEENVAELSGGAVAALGRSAVALHGDFYANRVLSTVGRGGVIFFDLAEDAPGGSTLANATMTANAADRGGAIFVSFPGAHLDLSGLRATQNLATLQGAVAYVGGASSLRGAPQFVADGNEAPEGIIACESNGKCLIDGLRASRNVVSTGTVYVDSGALTFVELRRSEFIGNRADRGSTIDVGSIATAVLVDVDCRDDIVQNQGGVISAAARANVTLRRVAVANATVTASASGVISATGADELTVDNATLSDTRGAVLRAVGVAAVTLSRVVVVRGNNVLANAAGGAIYLERSPAAIKETRFLANDGGALRVDASTVELTNSEFAENGGSSSALVLVADAQVTCDACAFRGNNASASGGAVTVGSGARFDVIDSTFVQNRALTNGGAVAVESNGVVAFRDEPSEFVANVAEKNGGALSFARSSTLNTTVRMVAHRNRAPSGGGGFLFFEDASVEFAPPDLFVRLLNASGNAATYGGTRATSVASIVAGHATGVEASGAPFATPLSVTALDLLNQTAASLVGVVDLVVFDSGASVDGGSRLDFEGGVARTASGFQVTARPGVSVAIDAFFRRDDGVELRDSFTIYLRECVVGEVRRAAFGDDRERCTRCEDSDRYSFTPERSTCDLCPSHASCSPKNASEADPGNVLRTDRGYWRSTKFSTNIRICPYRRFCKGGVDLFREEDVDAQCGKNHAGVLCAECAPETDYVLNPSTGECVKCTSSTQRRAAFVALGATVGSLAVLSLVALVLFYKCFPEHYEALKDKARRMVAKLDDVVPQLKIFFTFVQVATTQARTFFFVPYPKIYDGFLASGVVGLFNVDIYELLSRFCWRTTHLEKLRILTITPLAALAALGLAFLGCVCLDNGGKPRDQPTLAETKKAQEAKAHHPSSEKNRTTRFVTQRQRFSYYALLVSFLVYTPVSLHVFETFDCDSKWRRRNGEPDDSAHLGSRYLRADYTVRCTSPSYRAHRVYAAIMVLLYPVGIPLVYLIFLQSHLSRINPTDVAALARAVLKDGLATTSGGHGQFDASSEALDAIHPMDDDDDDESAGGQGDAPSPVGGGSAAATDDVELTVTSRGASSSSCAAAAPPARSLSGRTTSEEEGTFSGHHSPAVVEAAAAYVDALRLVEDAQDSAETRLAPAVARLGADFVIAHRAFDESCAHLRFIFEDYDPAWWFMEVLEAVRRLLLTSVIPVFYPGDNVGALYSTMLAAVFFSALYASTRPFASDEVDTFASIMQFTLSLILLLSLILFCEENVDSDEDANWSRQALGAILVVLTALTGPIIILLTLSTELENGVVNDVISPMSQRVKKVGSQSVTAVKRRASAARRRVETKLLRRRSSRPSSSGGSSPAAGKHPAATNEEDNKVDDV